MEFKKDDVVMVSNSEVNWNSVENQDWMFGILGLVINSHLNMVRILHTSVHDIPFGYRYNKDCVTKIGVL